MHTQQHSHLTCKALLLRCALFVFLSLSIQVQYVCNCGSAYYTPPQNPKITTVSSIPRLSHSNSASNIFYFHLLPLCLLFFCLLLFCRAGNQHPPNPPEAAVGAEPHQSESGPPRRGGLVRASPHVHALRPLPAPRIPSTVLGHFAET